VVLGLELDELQRVGVLQLLLTLAVVLA
jgi:hypothetical protein